MSAELLAHLDLFSFLGPDQIRALAVPAQTRVLRAGQTLFNEGDVGEEVFVVVDGLVRIHHAITLDADRTLAELGPGSMFGEAAIIDQDLRSAGASAVIETRLLVLDAGILREFMLSNPAEGLLIMGRLAAMMMDRLRTTNDRLKESMAWGLQVSGAAQTSLRDLVATGTTVDLHLRDQRHLRGMLVRADKDAGETTLWVKTHDERLHLVPFHAVTELVVGPSVEA